MSKARLLLTLVLCLMPALSFAQELWPGTRYDPKIPTIQSILGWDHGEEISSPDAIAAYLKALNAAAPDRTRLIEYARTWENRPLHVLVVGNPAHIAQLDAIKKGMQRLADPRGATQAELDQLVKEMPVITWLFHSVHGNEISGADAALAEAYHLLAAQGNADVDTVFRESLVLIDPSQNPDGRARFVAANQQGRAAGVPDADPASVEHDEPWPGGRSNHYLFDMNRDWFSMSQPETRGRIRIMLDFFPQVAVDLHEQSGDSEYYFAPPADPVNPLITQDQRKWLDAMGRANGEVFDSRGFGYFVREVFDAFYPGYGDSWPVFHGAIGMTYEMSSARGLRFQRQDGRVLTYREGVIKHFTSAITTAVTAAKNREAMLRDFLAYRQSAIRLADTGPKEYLIDAGTDPARAMHLARRLAAQGIEVRRADQAIKIGTRTLPVGSLIVPLAQPAGRLVRNLLDASIVMDEAFLKEQDRRRQRGLGDQIYDVTAWNLAMLYDLDIVPNTTPVTTQSTLVPREPSPNAQVTVGAASVGYIIPWGLGAAEAAVELLQAGVKMSSVPRAFTIAGRAYPGGSVFVRIQGNVSDLTQRLSAAGTRHGIEILPINSAFVDSGVSLGSNEVATLKAPKVLLAWDAPTSSLSAGWARYALEQRWKQPVTTVRTASMGRIDLALYDVLVLPSGNYNFNDDQMRRLRDWLGRGGTLVTIGQASAWAASERAALLPTYLLQRDGSAAGAPEDKKTPPKIDIEKFDYNEAIKVERGSPDGTAGAILRVKLDKEHWLSAGLDEEIQVVMEGSRMFMPVKLDAGTNVGVYAAKDRVVAAGFMWPEAQALVQQKSFLMHVPVGRGHVIAFAEDPNYRAFTEATALLFINAVLLGAGF